MTNWLDHVEGSTPFLQQLYGGSYPSLDDVELVSFALERTATSVRVILDLGANPVFVPPKWKAQGWNTVQVELVFVGIAKLECRGWSGDTRGGLTCDGAPLNVRFSGRGNGVDVDISFEAAGASLSRIAGYTDARRGQEE